MAASAVLAPVEHQQRWGWTKRIPHGCVVDRDAVIVEACRGKIVVHLGAADSPFHMDKARQGELLHQKIRGVATSVVGVDHDVAAVRWLQDQCGIDDILAGDLEDPGLLPDRRFERVLCCDVIEHVSNPGAVLDRCRSLLAPESLLVLTTVNGTALKSSLRAVLGRESVHPEHVSYFSYATVSQLLRRHGLEPVKIGFFCYPTVFRLSGLILRQVATLAPATADGVIVMARSGG